LPQLRKDPITQRWVIIATERAARPTDFVRIQEEVNGQTFCPFCEGREDLTPPEIYAIGRPGRSPNSPGWEVRVVPNKYPALRIEGTTEIVHDGLFAYMDGVGAHEVIIETPDHFSHLGVLPPEHVAKVIQAYRERYLDLDRDERFQYLLLFRNHGRTAGASLSHPHSQLIALPIVPKQVREELEAAQHHFGRHARCIYCEILAQEIEAGNRIVTENEQFVAFEPFASRFPFETWIMPKRHQATFGSIEDQGIQALAEILQGTLYRLAVVLDNPPYNFIIHSLPYNETAEHFYHWHIEIMPRLTQVAGFEWGTGFYINPVVPEDASRFLREAKAPEVVEVVPARIHGEVGE